MQEFNDGTFGEIKEAEKFKEIFENPEELAKTKAIHFGTEKELKEIRCKKGGAFGQSNINEKDNKSVKEYLRDVEEKLDMIIKHFKIVRIIGEGNNDKTI